MVRRAALSVASATGRHVATRRQVPPRALLRAGFGSLASPSADLVVCMQADNEVAPQFGAALLKLHGACAPGQALGMRERTDKALVLGLVQPPARPHMSHQGKSWHQTPCTPGIWLPISRIPGNAPSSAFSDDSQPLVRSAWVPMYTTILSAWWQICSAHV